jgi:phosphoglucomutase
MARAGHDPDIDAFAYISASHNPVGHNGVKFGLGGGVIGGKDAASLIDSYRRLIGAPGAVDRLADIASAAEHSAADRYGDPVEKRRCLEAYKEFLDVIAGGPGNETSRRDTVEELKRSLRERPVGIVADLNGSARCLSVDRDYLEGLGVQLNTFNDEAGVITHAILPEGDSLEPCRTALEKAHAEDENFLIGYVPDNDGDRGNLVVWDENIRGARILQAQEVFALSVLAEFASAAWGDNAAGGAGTDIEAPAVKSALAVNGPTSHRVRRIAEAYGAEVFEAEVGEANVVNLAVELRERGYRVRLLGEGSNGGTITHPAAVRDPLNTITALLKLLRLPGPFEDWCRRIDRPELFRSDFGPADILATLPVYSTTPASTPRALMAIRSADQGALKAAWEEVFAEEWKKWAADLRRIYGFADWYELNNERTTSRNGVGPEMRTGRQSGGLKMVFTDSAGTDIGFLWMRGSGTEPVFRVMAEIRGDRPEAETGLSGVASGHGGRGGPEGFRGPG